MKRIIGVFSVFLVIQIAEAQNSNMAYMADETLVDDQQRTNYIRFSQNYRVDETEVEGFINSHILSGSEHKVSVLNSEKDDLGFTHIRYNVLQNNLQVANKMIIAHCRDGKLISINGDLSEISLPVNKFILSEEIALKFALVKVNAKNYKWQNRSEEEHIQKVFDEPDFTYYPKGSKVIFEKEGKTYSAWVFNIYAEEPLYRANVFVDASSGTILDEQNLICHFDVPGTAVTKYSGTQSITCNQNGTQFQLKEVSRGLGVETYNLNYAGNYSLATEFTSASPHFSFAAIDEGALDAHWGTEKTYDYFLSQHNRNSIDNAGYKLLSYVHYQSSYANAFWDGKYMTYGDGNVNYNAFTSVDVCGHEISHGLTSHTSKLLYSYESGALNESYSDIFGICVEHYAKPSDWNWKMAEDVTKNGNGIRSLSDPNLLGQPDTYKGNNWYPGAIDNGGVHTNSGVSNFWFFLLATGGTGVNDFSNAYSISGLGISNAAKIAFRALTVYYTPGTNYAVARNLSIQAAKDLFGNCSNEMIQTVNAWHAVGVGQKYVTGVTSPDFTSGFTSFCSLPASVSFSNTTPNAVSYIWDFGDGSLPAATTNAKHTYTAAGNYNVKLKSVACPNGTDSIIKKSFVAINIIPSPAVVSSHTICVNTSVTLSASNSGIIKWYDSPTSTLVAGTGNNFTTPTITSETTYYAVTTVSSAPVTGGNMSNIYGYSQSANDGYLIFDVIATCTLNSVLAFPSTIGTRTVELRNSNDVLLNSAIINFSTTGTTTLNLNFPLAIGTDYRLKLSDNSVANLFRSSWNVSYPYNIGNCLSIVNSNKGAGLYFWFYNWEVQKEYCRSALVPVTIVPEDCTHQEEIPVESENFQVFPNPADENLFLKTSGLTEGSSLSIADATGRVVYHSIIGSPEVKIGLANFSGGLYLLSVKDPSGNLIKAVKVIKK